MTDPDRPDDSGHDAVPDRDSRPPTATPSSRGSLENTGELLRRVRSGDDQARDVLFSRYLPLLQRWARGRLPSSARNVAETDDLVQVTVIRALRQVDAFEPRREGAFLSYLRKILLNAVREEIRRTSRHPQEPLSESVAPEDATAAVSRSDPLELYEQALGALSDRQREATILRLEFGYSYAQIAEAVECASADAARMIVNRALVRVAEVMTGRGAQAT